MCALFNMTSMQILIVPAGLYPQIVSAYTYYVLLQHCMRLQYTGMSANVTFGLLTWQLVILHNSYQNLSLSFYYMPHLLQKLSYQYINRPHSFEINLHYLIVSKYLANSKHLKNLLKHAQAIRHLALKYFVSTTR